MRTCVYCDRELHPAPTKLGWVDKPGGFGLCYDCIQRCYEVMVAHRKAEAAAVDSGAGEHIHQHRKGKMLKAALRPLRKG